MDHAALRNRNHPRGTRSTVGDHFSLTDTELDTVTTQGKLFLGDRATTKVDYLEADGVSYTSAALGTFLESKYSSIGDTKVLGSSTEFTNNLKSRNADLRRHNL